MNKSAIEELSIRLEPQNLSSLHIASDGLSKAILLVFVKALKLVGSSVFVHSDSLLDADVDELATELKRKIDANSQRVYLAIGNSNLAGHLN